MHQDLSTCYDWPVKKAIVNLQIRLKGNSERISGHSLSPLGAENKDIGAASQTSLTGVSLLLQRRLHLAKHGHVGVLKLSLHEDSYIFLSCLLFLFLASLSHAILIKMNIVKHIQHYFDHRVGKKKSSHANST